MKMSVTRIFAPKAGARFIIFCLLVASFLYVLSSNRFYIGFFNDDTVYICLTRSLLEGTGYRDIFLPDSPLHLKYPPGFPVILLPFVYLAGGGVSDLLRIPGILFALAGLACVLRIFGPRLQDSHLLLFGLLLVFNNSLIWRAGVVMSDAPFLCLLYLFFALAQSPRIRDSQRPVDMALLAALACVLTYTRTAGAILIAAYSVFLVARRKKISHIAIFCSVSAVLLLPYFLWRVAPGYGMDLKIFYPMQGAVQIFLRNLQYYILDLPLTLVADPSFTSLNQRATAFAILEILGGAACILAIWGFYREERRDLSPWGVFLPPYLVVLLFWPYAESRFLYPVIPLFIFYMVRGIQEARIRRAWLGKSLFGMATLILASQILFAVAGVSASLKPGVSNTPPFRTYEWIRKNVDDRDIVMSVSGCVYLYTAKKMIPLDLCRGREEKILENIFRRGVRYIFWEELFTMSFAGQDEKERRVFIDTLASLPGEFKRVFADPEERTAIYQVVSDGRAYLKAYDLFISGTASAARGDFLAAIPSLRECIRIFPGFPKAWFNLGFSLFHNDQPGEAIECINELLQRYPGYANAYFLEAEILEKMGDIRGSQKMRKKGKQIADPGKIIGCRAKGTLLTTCPIVVIYVWSEKVKGVFLQFKRKFQKHK